MHNSGTETFVSGSQLCVCHASIFTQRSRLLFLSFCLPLSLCSFGCVAVCFLRGPERERQKERKKKKQQKISPNERIAFYNNNNFVVFLSTCPLCAPLASPIAHTWMLFNYICLARSQHCGGGERVHTARAAIRWLETMGDLSIFTENENELVVRRRINLPSF